MTETGGDPIAGIHHVTALCGDPQRNLDFYTGFLGLRLVKKTVNFDEPGTYHLYYGDGIGSPGTILTVFPWILPPMVRADGRPGNRQMTATPFRIPAASLDFWMYRFAERAVPFEGPHHRFGESVLSFTDPDGLPLELIARGTEGAATVPWEEGPIPVEHAIRGVAGATLSLDGYERTASLLTGTLGFREIGREGSRFRFQVGEGRSAAMIDLLCRPEGEPGRMGIGTVHHIAWRTPDQASAEEWRRRLAAAGQDVTPILDRNYFESIYFREPGGVLFEIATDAPGFDVDESRAELGSGLKLPPWIEPQREQLEARLPELRIRRATW